MILREILVLGLDRYCFKVSVAVNPIKLGGVFTEFGVSKLVKKQRFGLFQVPRGTLEQIPFAAFLTVHPGILLERRVQGLDTHSIDQLPREKSCCAVLPISRDARFSPVGFVLI